MTIITTKMPGYSTSPQRGTAGFNATVQTRMDEMAANATALNAIAAEINAVAAEIGTALGGGVAPYDAYGCFNGVPTADLVLVYVPVAREITFPASLTGSRMIARTAATASTVFSIKKNGTEFGTATFAAAGTSATFTAASETIFSAGDILTMTAPSTADATLAGLGWVLVGTR